MQVTQEDGGRLNAFAKEPRMQIVDAGEAAAGSSRVLLISGAALVLLMLGVAVRIS
ncbi:MAG: high light inducible protein [Cyanobacteriota bacterium]|nr:high light inducible protein [Cyanobacteriota bacterium]